MDKNKIISGVGVFFKKLFLGLGLIVVVVVAVNWLFFGDDAASTQQVAQKQIDIVVSSQTVKAVNGKYRYFFDIRNNSEEPFAGGVSVTVVNAEGDSVYDETFSTNQPISAGLGTSVYFDINTGPTSVHGVNGIKTYTYEAKVDGQVVKTGAGTIQPLSQ
jgi:hypothetical protein